MARRRLPAAPAPAAVEVPRWPPLHLTVFDPADWLPPGETSDEAHREGYQAHLAAVADWDATHELPSFAEAAATPDELFTGDNMLTINARRVSRAELAGAQAGYAAKLPGR